MSSWVQYVVDHPFPIQNLPFGCGIIPGTKEARPLSAIGDFVIDLRALSGSFDAEVNAAFQKSTLNAFMALGYDKWTAVRQTLQKLFSKAEPTLRDNKDLQSKVLIPQKTVQMVLPADIGDYTDFYASREHATNLGKMFRPGQPALLENWLHIPVGYHGRASSIVVSGTPLRRPHGQQRPKPEEPPVFGASKAVDFELEMAAYIGVGNDLGAPISVDATRKAIFGFSLFNDWSARDIQKWEYVPLGPFLGKNFGSTISPWIITTAALEPFLVDGPAQEDPAPLPYLLGSAKAPGNYDVNLSVSITQEDGTSMIVSETNWKYMYWSVYQQLCHHTINGCNMRPGDVIASGTISGPTGGSYGSMIELAWQGTKPISFPNGTERKMIQDGDIVSLNGFCKGDGYRIGFGECASKILPAVQLTL